MRFARLAVALCLFGGLIGTTVARGDGQGVTRSSPRLSAAEAAVLDAAVRLNSPAARAERRRSRTAFRGRVGSVSARRIAAEAFGSLVSAPLWTAPRLRPDERKVRMLGSHAMVIERNGKPAGIVRSTVPLRNASKRPTDLRLTERRGAFAPLQPLARTRIGKRLHDGVELPAAGVTVTPLMPVASARGSLAGARVFYPDAATDTDVIVGAAPAGAAIFYQLRSPRSPGDFQLQLTVPPGARTRPSVNGRGGAEVVRADTVVATVEPPSAVDAQGRPVPARYAIAGDRITVTVGHRGGGYAYPILLDPVVDQQLWWLDTTPTFTDWFYRSSIGGGYFVPATSGSWGAGLYSGLGGGRFYPNLNYGEWVYPLYGTAFAYRVTFGWEREQTNSTAQAVCMTVGLRNAGNVWDQAARWTDGIDGTPTGVGPRTRCHTFNTQALGEGTDVCLLSTCAAPATHVPNFPVFQQWAFGDAVRNGFNVSYVGAGVVYITDPEAPTIGGAPPATAERTTAWSVTYGDPGLGVKTVQLDSPGNADWDLAQSTTFNCLALNHSRCPASATLAKTFGNLPAGPQTIRLRVTDAVGHLTTRTWSVFVEGQADAPDAILDDDPTDPEQDPDETGPPDPELSAVQRDLSLSLITTDLEAVLDGRPYSIELGPWTEESAAGEAELVGAIAEITFQESQSWSERDWPVVEYSGDPARGGGRYSRNTIRASASAIGVLDVNVDLRIGEVVNAYPDTTALPEEPPPGVAAAQAAAPPSVTRAPNQPVHPAAPTYEGY